MTQPFPCYRGSRASLWAGTLISFDIHNRFSWQCLFSVYCNNWIQIFFFIVGLISDLSCHVLTLKYWTFHLFLNWEASSYIHHWIKMTFKYILSLQTLVYSKTIVHHHITVVRVRTWRFVNLLFCGYACVRKGPLQNTPTRVTAMGLVNS